MGEDRDLPTGQTPQSETSHRRFSVISPVSPSRRCSQLRNKQVGEDPGADWGEHLLGDTWLREYSEQDHNPGYELMKRTAEAVIKRLQSARKYLVELQTESRT